VFLHWSALGRPNPVSWHVRVWRSLLIHPHVLFGVRLNISRFSSAAAAALFAVHGLDPNCYLVAGRFDLIEHTGVGRAPVVTRGYYGSTACRTLGCLQGNRSRRSRDDSDSRLRRGLRQRIAAYVSFFVVATVVFLTVALLRGIAVYSNHHGPAHILSLSALNVLKASASFMGSVIRSRELGRRVSGLLRRRIRNLCAILCYALWSTKKGVTFTFVLSIALLRLRASCSAHAA